MAWPWMTDKPPAAPGVPPQPSRIFRPIEAGLEIMKNTVRDIGTGGSIQSAREALAQAEHRLVELQDERARKLADAEGAYLAEVDAIDRQIEAQQRAMRTHQDRISALNAEMQRQAQLKADRELADRVAATERALRDRDAIAVKLEAAIRAYGDVYFELVDKNLEISRQWGMSNNALRVGLLYEKLLAREVSHALFSAGRPHHGVSRLPAPGTEGLGIAGDTATGGLADRIAEASRELQDMIRAVPTSLPNDEAA
jgi:hypothetical protein